MASHGANKKTQIMGRLLAVFVIMTIFGGTALIVYIISSFRLRTKILRAGKLDLTPEQIKALYKNVSMTAEAPLKWGLILFSGGLGLVLIDFLNADLHSTLPWGIEVIFVSMGFLTYYALTKNKADKKEL